MMNSIIWIITSIMWILNSIFFSANWVQTIVIVLATLTIISYDLRIRLMKEVRK